MSRIRDFIRRLADVLDPSYESPLQFPPSDSVVINRTRIFRFAGMTERGDIDYGEFEIIGRDLATRIGRAIRPREVHLLEDLSQAFSEVLYRADQPVMVADVHVRRATEAIVRYFHYIGRPSDPNDVEQKIRQFVDETSRFARERNQLE